MNSVSLPEKRFQSVALRSGRGAVSSALRLLPLLLAAIVRLALRCPPVGFGWSVAGSVMPAPTLRLPPLAGVLFSSSALSRPARRSRWVALVSVGALASDGSPSPLAYPYYIMTTI